MYPFFDAYVRPNWLCMRPAASFACSVSLVPPEEEDTGFSVFDPAKKERRKLLVASTHVRGRG